MLAQLLQERPPQEKQPRSVEHKCEKRIGPQFGQGRRQFYLF
jgi:hypothetical protein